MAIVACVSISISMPKPIRDLPLFWRVHLVGWGLFIILSIPLKTTYYESLGYAILLSIFREPVGLLLTSAFRPIFRWGNVRADRPLKVAAWAFPLSFAAAGIDLWIGQAIAQLSGHQDSQVLGPYLFRSLLFLVWSLLYLGVKDLLDARERLLVLSRAETAARDAEILMLRAQVSPHFLFNAFNTILAELDGRNPALVPVVRGLSDYFRYSLANRNDVFVKMKEEYDAMLSYLTVEKARFQESLRLDCEMEPGLENMRVPGIILQPLIENALKYGHMTSPTPLRLRMRVQSAAEGRATVEVANSGRWVERPSPRPSQDPGGNGLSILKRRLELLYPENHSLEIHHSPDGDEVVIRIHLPQTPDPSTLHDPSNPDRHR